MTAAEAEKNSALLSNLKDEEDIEHDYWVGLNMKMKWEILDFIKDLLGRLKTWVID